MNTQDIILKKRNGEEMNNAEIEFLVQGISDGSIPDYQTAAWAMAVYFQGMTERETNSLALAMAYSGEVLDLSCIAGIKVDKHSTGGVGDKTTLVVVPLAAAAGVPIAKMSGRGLGHTGGTIDKFEAIPGFQVEKTYQQFVDQVNRINAAVVAQTGNLVPADKKLYAIRDVTATVDSIPLIAASIMSKKIAAGAQGIVLDVKVGSGAFMKNERQALQLARTMIKIGQGSSREVVAVLTDMSQPLGEMVGNALEVKEAIDLLRGHGPADLEELSVCLTAHMLLLARKCSTYQQASQQVQKILSSGAGFDKFCALVTAQEGRLDYQLPFYGLPQAKLQSDVQAAADGYVAAIDAMEVGRAAMLLGAGRERLGD
ncbi:MAG: thymidine phosphorylase, partial [Firmicutes bacterium]|nr:thymidine phosphorylase [Bacillota bacterium]